MTLTGTLAEVKSASKQLRKYGWRNVDLVQIKDEDDDATPLPDRWTLTLTSERVSPR